MEREQACRRVKRSSENVLTLFVRRFQTTFYSGLTLNQYGVVSP
ncbi:hypothetical protein HMPREF1051_1457 [Neisseria sicca VK64]|uniref:Uncharacterized protein n=1 Tax=Neisseria sicca VK64 TaxID=1095748 RepID=I2NUL8_NEISI|nr:hypothetical protein HMPREF1051_1457 [Neisseria sicca VK64]